MQSIGLISLSSAPNALLDKARLEGELADARMRDIAEVEAATEAEDIANDAEWEQSYDHIDQMLPADTMDSVFPPEPAAPFSGASLSPSAAAAKAALARMTPMERRMEAARKAHAAKQAGAGGRPGKPGGLGGAGGGAGGAGGAGGSGGRGRLQNGDGFDYGAELDEEEEESAFLHDMERRRRAAQLAATGGVSLSSSPSPPATPFLGRGGGGVGGGSWPPPATTASVWDPCRTTTSAHHATPFIDLRGHCRPNHLVLFYNIDAKTTRARVILGAWNSIFEFIPKRDVTDACIADHLAILAEKRTPPTGGTAEYLAMLAEYKAAAGGTGVAAAAATGADLAIAATTGAAASASAAKADEESIRVDAPPSAESKSAKKRTAPIGETTPTSAAAASEINAVSPSTSGGGAGPAGAAAAGAAAAGAAAAGAEGTEIKDAARITVNWRQTRDNTLVSRTPPFPLASKGYAMIQFQWSVSGKFLGWKPIEAASLAAAKVDEADVGEGDILPGTASIVLPTTSELAGESEVVSKTAREVQIRQVWPTRYGSHRQGFAPLEAVTDRAVIRAMERGEFPVRCGRLCPQRVLSHGNLDADRKFVTIVSLA